MENKEKVIQACEDSYVEPYISNCSGFLRNVAKLLGVNDNNFLGTDGAQVQANTQIDRLALAALWTELGSGDEGANKARQDANLGKFVVAGWKNPSGHGHVAVVVAGAAQLNNWPLGYWGSISGARGSNTSLRSSFGASKRPNVRFFSRNLPN